MLAYKAPSDFNEKLKTQLLRRDESVLRFMYTALDKYAVQYNARKAKGISNTDKKEEVVNG